MDDVRGFADYLRNPLKGAWKPTGGKAGFLVVSSEIGREKTRSWADRQRDLQARVSRAKLVWIRASDLVDFAMALERAGVTPEHRELIDWARLLRPGDIRGESFTDELRALERFGYRLVA
jgi:translation elongation factor EF-Tu-like GTPase